MVGWAGVGFPSGRRLRSIAADTLASIRTKALGAHNGLREDELLARFYGWRTYHGHGTWGPIHSALAEKVSESVFRAILGFNLTFGLGLLEAF